MELFTSLLWLKETDSTQNRLKDWNLSYGSVVVADRQTAGRGRLGRRWVSQEGGLYFSFLLNPKGIKNLIQLPLVLGLSLSESLENLGIRTQIKWVNDVYINRKKVAGILCELSGEKLIVGIGVNVNQREIPEELKDRATSLFIETGKEFDRKEILLNFFRYAERNLRIFKEKGFTPFKKNIEEKLLYAGEEVRIIGSEEVRGKLVGLSERGGALLLTEEGLKEFISGELSLRPL